MHSFLLESQLEMAMICRGMEIQEEPLGSNLGKFVEIFLEDAGCNDGDAWCMAFVYWCHLTACRRYPTFLIPDAPYLEKTGWCKGQWLYAKTAPNLIIITADIILSGTEIPRGAIWIRYDGAGKGHTGFVADHDPDKKTIISIEGNASDRVQAKKYKIPDIANFKGVIH